MAFTFGGVNVALPKNLLQSDLALHDSEHRLQAVADNVPALIGYSSRELRCEFANQRYRGMFHLEPQQITGMHLRDLLGAARFETVDPTSARPSKVMRSASSNTGKRRTDRKHAWMSATSDRHSSGVRGCFVLVADVSDGVDTP